MLSAVKTSLALTVGGLLVLTQHANALSCMKPDIKRAFEQAIRSDTVYVVLKGTFDVPKRESLATEPQTITATFQGQSVSSVGFSPENQWPVIIELTCAGSFCARLNPETEYLSFVEVQDGKLFYPVRPCHDLTFYQPNAQTLRDLRTCIKHGSCESLGEN